MKLSVLLLIVTMLQVSASSLAQRITLQQKNADLKDVLAEIRKQTGYDFIFSTSTFKDAKKVNIDVRDADLELVLTKIFKDQPLQFKINDNKSVVITKKDKSVFDTIIDYFSAIDVRGKVLDEQGQPLMGATVKVKGGTIGTMTDKEGEFFLKGVPEDAVIVIAYLGYKPLELKASASMGVIKMELSASELDEVVVNKGYYTETQRLSTGSVVKVSAKDIERQPVTSPLMSLQGRIPGIDITPNSGVAGDAVKVMIRGQNSISNINATPLYIIDGMPVNSTRLNTYNDFLLPNGFDPLSTLNPANIQSIEVLKDADATAIYGSRGANGVILITSKIGRKTEKTDVDINFYSGAGKIPRFLNLLTTSQYLALRHEAFANDNRTPTADPNDQGNNGKLYAPDLKIWDTTRYTDWQQVLLGGTATITDLQANVSSGNTVTNFRFGGGYHMEGTIYGNDFGYHRATVNFSLNHNSVNKKFGASLNMNYGKESNKLFSGTSLVDVATVMPPNAPALYDSLGKLNWQNSTFNNPLVIFENTDINLSTNIVLNSVLSYEFIRGLMLKVNLGYNDLNRDSRTKVFPFSALDPATITGATRTTNIFGNNKRSGWIIEPQAIYHRQYSNLELNIVAGTSLQENSATYQLVQAFGYTSDLQSESLKGATQTDYVTDDNLQYRYMAVFSRIGFDYKGKYALNFTGRRDGSSRFGPDRRWGNFGAFGAAWIFSEETFGKKFSFLSFGKIRASYGVTGSDQISDYEYLSRYANMPNRFQDQISLAPTGLTNSSYAWEQTVKLEAAIELGFLHDRIRLEAAFYRNRCGNQLLKYQLPGTTGYPGVTQNLDAVVENKGLELSLQTVNVDHALFQWRSSFNFTLPYNKLVSYPGIEESPYANTYVIGQPLSIAKVYKYIGVNPTTGIYEIKDVDNNGTYDFHDQTYINTGRRYYGGLNNTFRYKGLELSFLLQFAQQRSLNGIFYAPGSTPNNLPREVVGNYWRKEGEVSKYQKPSTDYEVFSKKGPPNSSDAAYVSSAFIRVKTASLLYTLPSGLLKKLTLSNMGVFLQAQNLWTVSNFKALDPEIKTNSLPPLRMITAGLNIKL